MLSYQSLMPAAALTPRYGKPKLVVETFGCRVSGAPYQGTGHAFDAGDKIGSV